MNQEKDIKYLNKTFSDFKNDLIELSKNYFPDTYNDFSDASPGQLFMEMAAYIGDVLSFYTDTQIQETYLQYAKDPSNLYTLAYTMGYTPKVTTVSEVELEVTQEVDSDPARNYAPDWSQALFISENSSVRASTNNATPFILKSSVDFRTSSSYQPIPEVLTLDGSGNPLTYLLKRNVSAFSGEIVTITRTVGSSQKFLTLDIEDENIVGILDIVDSDTNTWYEVPFLGQDTVFTEQNYTDTNRGSVSKKLELTKVPRRFITRFTSENNLRVQFGSGVLSNVQEETLIPNPENVGLKTANGVSRIDYFYNPANFLFSNTYGLAPSNTTLTIRYIRGGGISANEPASTITQQVNVSITGPSDKQGTLTFNNLRPASGGKDGDTVTELRENSLRSFSEQGRTVTLQDYVVRALSLPSRFGGIDKAYALRDSLSTSNVSINEPENLLSTSLYVLSKNSEGKLIIAPDILKQNLKNYLSQYIMITDSINIKDGYIINFGVEYEILPLPGFFGRDVLLSCTQELIDYFNISNWNINQPINIAEIVTRLDRIKGVQSVQKIKFVNKVGGNYSEYAYDFDSATKDNIIYPSLDPSIFEIKFPNEDIKGRIVSR